VQKKNKRRKKEYLCSEAKIHFETKIKDFRPRMALMVMVMVVVLLELKMCLTKVWGTKCSFLNVILHLHPK